MKYIFDFDDVLFDNTKKFKEHMYACVEQAGISRELAETYYKTVRTNKFWLKDFLAHFGLPENVYEKIVGESPNFTNKKLVEILKSLGKENCYIVTHGHDAYQRDKIQRTGIDQLVSEVIVVSDSKKEAVEKICAQHQNEKVLFIDDKAHHFENLDFKKYPNLKTILYTGQNLDNIQDL